MTNRIEPPSTNEIKTLVRSSINGYLYVSRHLWKSPVDALRSATILDKDSFFLASDSLCQELAETFGDMVPESPGEYSTVN